MRVQVRRRGSAHIQPMLEGWAAQVLRLSAVQAQRLRGTRRSWAQAAGLAGAPRAMGWFMATPVQVRFADRSPDPRLEMAVRRWVDRLVFTQFAVVGAVVMIEPAGRHTEVTLRLVLGDGTTVTSSAYNADAFLAVADAFRDAREALAPAAHAPHLGR